MTDQQRRDLGRYAQELATAGETIAARLVLSLIDKAASSIHPENYRAEFA